MTPTELKLKCLKAKATGGGVILVIPRVSSGATIGLTKDGGPRGEIRCVNSRNETVASFDPEKVLAWIAKVENVKGKQ